jgi:hypothetical protein
VVTTMVTDMNRETAIALVYSTILLCCVTGAYKLGEYEGHMEGATRGRMIQLYEVRRMCESRLLKKGNLLLGNEFYTCRPTGKTL